ncbi:MAG: CopG family transcriptional regulator [Thermoanaerobaculia bacterium]
MRKTTIYLPDEMKKRIEKVARTSGKSEADVIRDAIDNATLAAGAPVPRIPLLDAGLGDPTIAENVDALLESFGR